MRPKLPDDAEILAVFPDDSRRPLHVNDIAERLGLSVTVRRPLGEALDAMATRGLLSALPGSRYRMPKTGVLELQGRFSQNPRGFGFVETDDGGADVFIPPTGVCGAMHGDRVAISAHQGPNGREGVVVRVVLRRPPRIPGVLRIKARGSWIEPDDARIRGPIPVEEVGTGQDGEAVVCEIVRWPEHAGELPIGKVRQSLGRPGQLDVEVQKVLLREGVEEDFPPDVAMHAQSLPSGVLPEEYAGREDLRSIPFVTIDPDDARDHDDAVYVSRREHGGYVAWVAIADVSHYVRAETPLDTAALARGTSIYLPDRAIPMLPRELSSHLASLVEGEDRLALVLEIHVSSDGKVEKPRAVEAVIRCHAGLTYSNVAWVLGWGDSGKPSQQSDAAVRARGDLEVAAELAGLLHTRRVRRGSLEFDLPEARVRFADDGSTPIDIVQSRQDPGLKRAYGLVEELMLLANETVAAMCLQRRAPTIFRVHGEPDSSGLLKLSTVARAYGFDLDPAEAAQPKKLARFVRKIAETPSARVLGMLLLRSMPQAQYHVENRGHFGLAAEAYLHFTSPIRRYPDIVVHRVLRQLIRNEKVRDDDDAVQAMRTAATESSRLERRAMDVERDALDLYRCVVASAHVGELHSGLVSGLTNSGPFVQIEGPFVDVMIRVAELGHGDWQMDPLGVRLFNERTGASFALGDSTMVEIADVSMARRTVYGKLPSEMLETMFRGRGRGREEKRRAGRGQTKRAKSHGSSRRGKR